MFLPLQAKAIFCTNEKRTELQTLASNITTSYTYTEANGTITFQIRLSNIYNGFSIKDTKNDVTYPYRGSELVISDLKPNTNYRFDVYTNDISCDESVLYSHYVTTPHYNPYYSDPVCIGAENYSLCQKWSNVTISYEKFVQEVEEFKKEEEVPIIYEQEKSTKGIADYLLEFYLEYYYIILPVFIIGGCFIIYRYNKKNDLF